MKLLAAGLALLFAVACGDDGNDDSEAVAHETAAAVSSSAELASVSQRFEALELLATTPIATAPQVALTEVEARIRAAVTANECLGVDTDQATYIDLAFDDCRVGLFGLGRLDGALSATLSFETASCGPGTCPAVMIVTLATDRLRISGPAGGRWFEVVGTWELRDPIIGDAPTTTESDLTFSRERGSQTFDGSSSFTFDTRRCIELDAEVRLVVVDRDDLGDIAVAVDSLARCPNQCPTGGDVSIAFGAGEILAWEYSGAGQAVAVGPRGKELDVALPCALD